MKIRKWLRHKLVFPGLSLLPIPVAYRIAGFIGFLDSRRHPTRAVVEDGLATLLPELAGQPQQLEQTLQQYFRMMAKDMLDCFLMPKFTEREVKQLIRVHNADVLKTAQAAGHGVIMIVSHFGRFFMLAPGLRFAGVEFSMFTTVVDVRHPSYDAVDRWYIGRKVRNALHHCRGSWITVGDDIRNVYRALQAGNVIAIALDGNETKSRTRYEFPFCDGTLSLPEGIVRMAKRTGAKLVFASVIDRGQGVDLSIHPLPDEPVEGLGAAVRCLERDLLANPGQWWLWAGVRALWRPGRERGGTVASELV